MRRGVVAGGLSFLAAAVIVAVPATSSGAAGGGGTRAIPAGGTTSIRVGAEGPDGLQQPELRPGGEEDEPARLNRDRPGFKNGKFPEEPLDAPKAPSSSVAASNPDLVTSGVLASLTVTSGWPTAGTSSRSSRLTRACASAAASSSKR